MRKGTALADRKETEFATLGERRWVAIESYRVGRRSMDYELKEFRSQRICIKPMCKELLEEIGRCLWGLMYDFWTEPILAERDGELCLNSSENRDCIRARKKESLFPSIGEYSKRLPGRSRRQAGIGPSLINNDRVPHETYVRDVS